MKKLTFITLTVPGRSTDAVFTLANSIRTFGGKLNQSPIWILVPESMNKFSDKTLDRFEDLNIDVIPFEINPEVLKFPFAAKVIAAAFAEETAQGKTNLLIWLDIDNIILREPQEFLLPEEKLLGYRPVHHKLIGTPWGNPLDDFWTLVYQSCHVPGGQQFKMVTHTGEEINPYFNAGTFIVRTDRGLLSSWRESFLRLYQLPEFQAFYELDKVYAIFIHQAIFTGVLLHELSLNEIQELSPKINYPLHLHLKIPEEIRSQDIHELTTLRYENIFDNQEWQNHLPISGQLRNWLLAQPIIKI